MTVYKPMNLKVGDRRPYLEVQLLQFNGKPLDVTGADLTFTMRKDGDTSPTIDGEDMVITSAKTGLAEYRWGVNDTAAAGFYRAEVTITWPGGVKETQPDDGYIIVHINPPA